MVAKRVDERPVAGFNLVAVIDGEGLCLHYDGTLRPVPFGKGAHVVSTNRDIDDPSMDEKRLLDTTFASLQGAPNDASLMKYLASHAGERPICKHGEKYGTVSSTIYVEGAEGQRLLHAAGRPCETPYRDYSELLR